MIILQKEMLSLFVLLTKRRMVQLFFFFNKNKKNEYNKIKIKIGNFSNLCEILYCAYFTISFFMWFSLLGLIEMNIKKSNKLRLQITERYKRNVFINVTVPEERLYEFDCVLDNYENLFEQIKK